MKFLKWRQEDKMKQIILVLMETYRRQVKSWSFILLVLSPFIFIFVSLGFGYASSRLGDNASDRVAIVSSNRKIASQFRYDKKKTTLVYQTKKDARKALDKEKIAGYLVLEKRNGQFIAKYVGEEKMGSVQLKEFGQLLQQKQQELNIQTAKITSQQLKSFSKQPILKQKIIAKGASDATIKTISFVFIIFLMYFILIIYTSAIAQDIASEKGTKIMEMIFSSMPAKSYFYGKVLGTFAVIATHLLIYTLGGGLCYFIMPKLKISQGIFSEYQDTINKIITNLVSINLLYVLLGVILFTILAALCGALVVRPEDVSKAIQPVMYIVMLGFFGALTLGQDSNNLIVKWASFIPFLSSFFMPIRLIYGNVSIFQLLLSLGLLVLSAFFLARYVGSLYASLILQTDDIGIIKSFKRASKMK